MLREEANDRPKQSKNGVNRQMHKTVYADGLGIQCLSECLGLIIVVFKESSQGSWGRFVFAPEFSAEDMAKARQGEAPVVWKLKQNIFSQCMLLNTPECHARDFFKTNNSHS